MGVRKNDRFLRKIKSIVPMNYEKSHDIMVDRGAGAERCQWQKKRSVGPLSCKQCDRRGAVRRGVVPILRN